MFAKVYKIVKNVVRIEIGIEMGQICNNIEQVRYKGIEMMKWTIVEGNTINMKGEGNN
jgi:hypothetical protein